MHPQLIGILFAAASFGIWTLYPLMWHALTAQGAQPFEILAHRILWAHVFCWVVLMFQSDQKAPDAWPKTLRAWALCVCNGALNLSNWLICIWAATSAHMVEASFGYLLAPLIAAGLGLVVFKERLQGLQRLGMAIAAVTVVIAFATSGQWPWVSLLAGSTAAGYVALRKHVTVPPITGTLVETVLLVPCALGFLAWKHFHHGGVFATSALPTVLCVGAGLMTALALLFYAHATRRLKLATLGVMQYSYPCGQLLLGVFFFHEPFTLHSGFMCAGIFVAIVLYSIGSIREACAEVEPAATSLPSFPKAA